MYIFEALGEIVFIATAVIFLLTWLERKQYVLHWVASHQKILEEDKETNARKNITKIQQIDPIVAYKKAHVLDTGELAGVGYQDRYKPYDQAICRHGRPHPVPSISCTCGFWGLPSVKALNELGLCNPNTALLQVEFYGEIIRLEKGYRAGKQRILSIGFPRICTLCYNLADAILSLIPLTDLKPQWRIYQDIVYSESGNILDKIISPQPAAASLDSDSPLMSYCKNCIEKLEEIPMCPELPGKALEFKHWSMADIANKFQVEATWTEQVTNTIWPISKKNRNCHPQIVMYHADTQKLAASFKKG